MRRNQKATFDAVFTKKKKHRFSSDFYFEIFKESNFEVTFHPARESPIETLRFMWYTQLVLRLGTEIFMISRRIKMLPSWAFLGPSRAGSRPSLKIPQKFQRLDISGMKTTKKPIANISLRFERKKNLPKNGFF